MGGNSHFGRPDLQQRIESAESREKSRHPPGNTCRSMADDLYDRTETARKPAETRRRNHRHEPLRRTHDVATTFRQYDTRRSANIASGSVRSTGAETAPTTDKIPRRSIRTLRKERNAATNALLRGIRPPASDRPVGDSASQIRRITSPHAAPIPAYAPITANAKPGQTPAQSAKTAAISPYDRIVGPRHISVAPSDRDRNPVVHAGSLHRAADRLHLPGYRDYKHLPETERVVQRFEPQRPRRIAITYDFEDNQ